MYSVFTVAVDKHEYTYCSTVHYMYMYNYSHVDRLLFWAASELTVLVAVVKRVDAT